MANTFQRARSEEQRAVRRKAILDTTAAMLGEMPVAQVSLNELSRRVGLAKSNVLRYFESREAVLLELLATASQELLERLDTVLPEAVDADAPVTERADQVAAALTDALAERPVLCDLISAQGSVLERNVSTDVAAEYKRATIAHVFDLAGRVRTHVPELGEQDAVRFITGALMIVTAAWPHAHPSPAVLAVYESDPELAVLRLHFATVLRESLEVMLSGLLARAAG
ncbi:TetR family transcriptional regulator [Streptomyces phaeochromogenes]|uniref:TetR/AcrR family transcriptional regulator n=1 Tax=Streptomyces phaeochromogenes TaxID=1923 RepID=UPI0033F23184